MNKTNNIYKGNKINNNYNNKSINKLIIRYCKCAAQDVLSKQKHNKVYEGKYSIYQCVQAAIEWLAVCLSEYRQLKPLTASALITMPLFVNTVSYHPLNTQASIK